MIRVSPLGWFLATHLLLIPTLSNPIQEPAETTTSLEDVYNQHFSHIDEDSFHRLVGSLNEIFDEESDENYTIEIDGVKITLEQLNQIMEMEEKKYVEWFFMSVPNDVSNNSTSQFEFNDPNYDLANFTSSARSWRNGKRSRWNLARRQPRDVSEEDSVEIVLGNTTVHVAGTYEEFLAEFNRNWTAAFFDLPKRERSKDVQLRFTAPRPFAASRQPRLLFLRDDDNDKVSPNDLDSPSDFQPKVNFSSLFFGTTHSMVGDNETILEVIKEMDKFEDSLTSNRQELYQNGTILPLDANKNHLEFMLFYGLDTPRDFQTNVTLRTTIARYLSNKMERFGLLAGTQTFEPHQYPEIFPEYIPKGINIIGVLPGKQWGTKDDELIILAAHWDTVPGSNGMDDNASGVAAVLEVARALTEAKCVTKYSVMFVLFDLEEVGCIGSIYFIRDYLIPHVLVAHGGAKMKGAYILDTIMNYNSTPGSQIWPEEWDRQIPGKMEELKEENMTGNFIAALYRNNVDSTLAKVMSKHFAIKNRGELSPEQRYLMKEFPMELSADMPPVGELAKWIDLLRSDHSRFWFHNLEYPWSFPAVLLTDTGPYRGGMQTCYHNTCDSFSGANYADVDFLSRTVQALIDSVVELSEAQCRNGPVTEAPAPEPELSFTFSSFVSSLVQILGQLGVNLGRAASEVDVA